jgi:hypothetical protein
MEHFGDRMFEHYQEFALTSNKYDNAKRLPHSASLSCQRLGNLIFKGTHNSYQCHGDAPNMGHLVNVQMDDFGVWE